MTSAFWYAATLLRAGNRWLLLLTVALSAATIVGLACGNSSPSNQEPLDPNPTVSEDDAIEIAKIYLDELRQEIDFAGYERLRVRIGAMRLRELQELTDSNLYSEDSPRLDRQIWAVQIGGTFPDDTRPYTIPFGYGIVGIDAENGDIWLRARYDHEILVTE